MYNNNNNNNNIDEVQESTTIKIYPVVPLGSQLKFQQISPTHRKYKNCEVSLENNTCLQLKRQNTRTEDSKFKFWVNWFDKEKSKNNSVEYYIGIQIGNVRERFGPITLWYNNDKNNEEVANKKTVLSQF